MKKLLRQILSFSFPGMIAAAKKLLQTASLFFIMLYSFGKANAQVAAVQSHNGAYSFVVFGGAISGSTIGWSFTVGTTPITVTQLGVFDGGLLTGLAESHMVGIWKSDGTLLSSITIPAGNAATLSSGYRYKPISPLDLTPGQTYTIGALYSPRSGDNISYGISQVYASQITFNQAASNGLSTTPTFGFPAINPLNPGAQGVFGPNFQFTTQPGLTINNVTQNEGNSGPTTYSFTVSLSSAATAGGVTFDIATADNTATTANNDYVARSSTSQIIPEGSTTYTFDVSVNSDVAVEPDESFFVNITNVAGAAIADGLGLGTIINDDVTTCPSTYTITANTPSQTATARTWTAPPTGGPYLVKITAAGAKGGGAGNNTGGAGAVMSGTFIVNAGQTLNLTAAAPGVTMGAAPAGYGNGGGGGGGSGAYIVNSDNTNTILIIAGGGGGAGNNVNGEGGSTGTCGGGAFSSYGCNGNGGGNVQVSAGRSGGGLLTSGETSGGGAGVFATGGGGFYNGGAGGGGIGGGGGGSQGAGTNNLSTGGGGGGGGYSGGFGSGGGNGGFGSGGGSINNGSNQTNTAGNNAGGGYVTIECLGTAGPTASVLSVNGASTICRGTSTNLIVTITGGTSPYTVVYSDGTNNFTENGYTSGAAIPVSPTVNTTYSLVSVTDAASIAGTGNSGMPTINVTNPPTWYLDADGDGYYVSSIQSCTSPGTGYTTTQGTAGDCNDDPNAGGAAIHAPVQYYVDADHDSYGSTTTAMVCSLTATLGYSTNNTDCNDGDASIHARILYYLDGDRDGYGSTVTEMLCSLTAPAGYSTNNTDCNDGDASVHSLQTYFRDVDGDTYGSSITTQVCSSTAPAGYVIRSGDCNDNNASINPGAVEVCGNKIDDNCNGRIDEQPCSPCLNATNFTTTNITATSATLNWTAVANPVQWQVQYKTTNSGSKWIDVLLTGNRRSVVISSLLPNQNYIWHIRAKCGNTWTEYSVSIGFKTLAATTTGDIVGTVRNKPVSGEETMVELRVHNYPNPFTNVTTLRYTLPSDAAVNLTVYNQLGQQVAQLVNGNRAAGIHTVNFNGTKTGAGIYLYQLQAVDANGKTIVLSGKMLMMK